MILLKRLGGNIVVYGYGYGISVPAEEILPFPLSVWDVYGEHPKEVHPEPMATMQEAGFGKGRASALGDIFRSRLSPRVQRTLGSERTALSSGKDRPISRR